MSKQQSTLYEHIKDIFIAFGFISLMVILITFLDQTTAHKNIYKDQEKSVPVSF